MENRLIKVAKRRASLWKASRQLRVGLLLFLGVLALNCKELLRSLFRLF